MKLFAVILGITLAVTAAHADSVKWQTDFNKAVAQAKADHKLVMVDVFTDWCGWCKKLDKDVYSNAKVSEKLSKDFVACKINPEKNSANRQLANKFGTRGYPHIVFVNGDGKKVYEIGGYVPAEKFTGELDAALKKAK